MIFTNILPALQVLGYVTTVILFLLGGAHFLRGTWAKSNLTALKQANDNLMLLQQSQEKLLENYKKNQIEMQEELQKFKVFNILLQTEVVQLRAYIVQLVPNAVLPVPLVTQVPSPITNP